MSRFVVCLFVVLALFWQKGEGHSYSLGSCPVVEPMYGFDWNKMLGIWYVIQKTSTASYCITYNFTKLPEPNHYLLEQASQHFALGLTPLKHDYHYTGYLKVTDPAVPARMTVKFPLNILGSASYTVFMTDYDNFAAVFTCQSLGVGHRRSASILSRSKTLDKVFIDKVRTRLASYNVDPFELSIISHNNCPDPKEKKGININIDPNTFTPESFAEAARTAGQAVGTGIEYVAGGAKKVYNTFSDAAEKVSENSGGKIKTDAEYISAPKNYNTAKSGQLRRDVEESDPDVWLP